MSALYLCLLCVTTPAQEWAADLPVLREDVVCDAPAGEADVSLASVVGALARAARTPIACSSAACASLRNEMVCDVGGEQIPRDRALQFVEERLAQLGFAVLPEPGGLLRILGPLPLTEREENATRDRVIFLPVEELPQAGTDHPALFVTTVVRIADDEMRARVQQLSARLTHSHVGNAFEVQGTCSVILTGRTRELVAWINLLQTPGADRALAPVLPPRSENEVAAGSDEIVLWLSGGVSTGPRAGESRAGSDHEACGVLHFAARIGDAMDPPIPGSADFAEAGVLIDVSRYITRIEELEDSGLLCSDENWASLGRSRLRVISSLPIDEETDLCLASILKLLGYETALIGPPHLQIMAFGRKPAGRSKPPGNDEKRVAGPEDLPRLVSPVPIWVSLVLPFSATDSRLVAQALFRADFDRALISCLPAAQGRSMLVFGRADYVLSTCGILRAIDEQARPR